MSMTPSERATIHGTAIAIACRGVLLLGPSGCGKSDLALRLIDAGALLIADDAVVVQRGTGAQSGRIDASPLPGARGRLMLHGIGVVTVAASEQPVALALAVQLGAHEEYGRARSGRGQSSEAWPFAQLGQIEPLPGRPLPMIALAAFEYSAARKVALALERWGF